MRRSPPLLARSTLAALLALPAGLSSCTYDFDRFEQAPAASGGSAGDPGGNHGGRDTNPMGGQSSGIAGSTAGTGDTGGTAGMGARSGAGGMGARTGTSGASGSGAAGSGGSAGSSGSSFDCNEVRGTMWNERCYFVVGAGTGLHWDEAKAACAENASAHLVSITSADEQTMLSQMFARANDDFWIGLSLRDTTSAPDRSCERSPEQCPFLWVDGESLSYTNWQERLLEREPNYSGACVRVQSDGFRWADVGCNNQLAAICEQG